MQCWLWHDQAATGRHIKKQKINTHSLAVKRELYSSYELTLQTTNQNTACFFMYHVATSLGKSPRGAAMGPIDVYRYPQPYTESQMSLSASSMGNDTSSQCFGATQHQTIPNSADYNSE